MKKTTIELEGDKNSSGVIEKGIGERYLHTEIDGEVSLKLTEANGKSQTKRITNGKLDIAEFVHFEFLSSKAIIIYWLEHGPAKPTDAYLDFKEREEHEKRNSPYDFPFYPKG